MARCSDLPPELIALIIDFHRGAQSSLHQCSLVCRAWLAPSQRRLFHTFRRFNLVKNVVPFRNFLLGAPHLGAYVREITVLGPTAVNYESEDNDFVADETDRENVQNLFTLLPNIAEIHANYLASSPFLFTNSLLRQCPKLCNFSIMASLDYADVLSPTAIFPTFTGTTVKNLTLRHLDMPSAIDSPLNLDAAMCSVEHLTLDKPRTFSVWLPYFRRILPHWTELKILSNLRNIQTWHDVLPATDLSHLRRLHVYVSIYLIPRTTITSQFPHDDPSPFLSCAPNLDHLLLTPHVMFQHIGRLSMDVVSSMVEWYLCTLTALSRGEKSTLKELTLTVMALGSSTVVAAWAKVDEVLSTKAYSRLEQVHFLDKVKNPITTSSYPTAVSLIKQALPKLSMSGKLAV